MNIQFIFFVSVLIYKKTKQGTAMLCYRTDTVGAQKKNLLNNYDSLQSFKVEDTKSIITEKHVQLLTLPPQKGQWIK